MTEIEQLVAAVKLEHPERSEDEILADLLERGLIHKGYVVDESMELESNVGRPHPARLVKEWVVLKDGRPEFRANTEEEGSNTWIGGCGRMRKKPANRLDGALRKIGPAILGCVSNSLCENQDHNDQQH